MKFLKHLQLIKKLEYLEYSEYVLHYFQTNCQQKTFCL
jgi:hypothetical protein